MATKSALTKKHSVKPTTKTPHIQNEVDVLKREIGSLKRQLASQRKQIEELQKIGAEASRIDAGVVALPTTARLSLGEAATPAEVAFAVDASLMETASSTTTSAFDVSGAAVIAPFEVELPFEPQPLPEPSATSDGFIPVPGHENFAGGGYADIARTRPAGLFGLASKIHDFGYTCNDLFFFRGPRYDKELSRFAKIDFIFAELNRKVWNEFRAPQRFSNWLSTIFFRGNPKSFLAGDGFVNVLKNSLLDNPDNYLMLPYSTLPPNQRRTHPEQRVVEEVRVGGRVSVPRQVRVVQVPSFNELVPLDRELSWRTWAAEKYSSTLWEKLTEIDDSTDSSFVFSR